MSLQSTPSASASRKRAQPITDPAVFPGNLAAPRSVHPGIRDPNFAPHRNRSIPNEYHHRNSKKNSLPTSPATSVSSFSVGQPVKAANFVTPNGTPSMNTFDWSAPQIQQGNFPDLKKVMFPSDNPFAYGNQPLSTLEDNQYGGLQDMSVDPFNNGVSSHYSSPDLSQPGQKQSQYSVNSFGGFDSSDSVNQIPQLNNSFGTPNMTNPFNISGSFVSEPDPMQTGQQGQEQEDYWSQPPGKGQFKTGLTPGGPAVNLEELFGGGNGWGPVPMGMDMNIPMGTMPNQGNPGAGWPSGNGNNNWQ